MAENAQPGDGWNLFQDILKANVTPITWQTWLRPLRSGDSSQDAVTVLAPTDFHLRWLVEKYGDLLQEAVPPATARRSHSTLKRTPSRCELPISTSTRRPTLDPASCLPAAINGNGPRR